MNYWYVLCCLCTAPTLYTLVIHGCIDSGLELSESFSDHEGWSNLSDSFNECSEVKVESQVAAGSQSGLQCKGLSPFSVTEYVVEVFHRTQYRFSLISCRF